MATSRHGLTNDLLPFVRETLGLDDISVVFQPIVDLASNTLFAYEALVRCGERFAGPIELIGASIESTCCGELGRLIRERAIEGCPTHPLFLNIHPREFDDGWLVRPDDPIFRHDHPVYLEITESVPLSHAEYCHGTLDEIRSMSVRLAIDDFGAGYSNLKYIADLAPEIVKLDRELIAGLNQDARLFKLVSSVVRMCRELDAKVLAEGVETRDELAAVRAAGAEYAQGFFLARPAFPPPTI